MTRSPLLQSRLTEGTASSCEQGSSEKQLDTQSQTGTAVLTLSPAAASPVPEHLTTPARWNSSPSPHTHPVPKQTCSKRGGEASGVSPFPIPKPLPAAPRARALLS